MDSYSSRFSGIGRLVSTRGLKQLRQSKVCVVGLGGVGSWVVEGLARSGVGELTLVDLDEVCISNVSRQLHALTSEFGKPKVEVMRRRVELINPDCVVHAHHLLFLKSTAEHLLNPGFHFVVDAIDDSDIKSLLIGLCARRGIPVITSGASAGRQDPTRIEVVDLAHATHDRLLMAVRKKLRKDFGFPRGDRPFAVQCVISREPMAYAREDGTVCDRKEAGMELRQDCANGLGAASFVTGVFGLVAAAHVVKRLAEAKHFHQPPAQATEQGTITTPSGNGR